MADTQLIKDRLDIVQLIQEYVPLKKAGVNWKGRCPFHQEKTPSFMVHPEKQIWHCFGCNKGGDIFSFIQEMEGLEFVEALKLLAERAGVKIDTYQSEFKASQRNRLLQINEAAAHFFHRFLLDLPAAAQAREYLTKRGLSDQTIKDWQLGFAPDQWDLLTQYLLKKGHGIDDLVGSGLTIKREGADAKSGRGYYDRFRGRIMFPLFDVHGTTVGFTGRVLEESPTSGGKYVNTPQTPVYDKSRVVYGLNQAKTEIKNQDLAVLVEGQMDVLACHQAGMKNVVAASGTALTPEQVKLLKRYSTNLAMAFDADAAGALAGERGIGVALAEGLQVRVIVVPVAVGKDADECLRENPAAWFQAVREATTIMHWHLQRVREKFDLNDPRQKQAAAERLLSALALVPSAVERDEWLKRFGEALSIEPAVLRDELTRLRAGFRQLPRVSTAPSAPAAAPLNIQGPRELLQTELWSLVVKWPEIFGELLAKLDPRYFIHTSWLNLYEQCKQLYTTLGRVERSELRQFFAIPDQENVIDVLELRPYRARGEVDAATALGEARGIADRLAAEWRRGRRLELQTEIAAAEQQNNRAQIEILFKELQQLN